MNENKSTLQDMFLSHLCKHKMPSTVFLINGVKLQGVVADYDAVSLLLQRDAHAQLVYKHAVSTVVPNVPIPLGESVPENVATGPA